MILNKTIKDIGTNLSFSLGAISDGPNSLGQRDHCQLLYLVSVQHKSLAVLDICQYQMNCLVEYGEQNTGELLFPLQ